MQSILGQQSVVQPLETALSRLSADPNYVLPCPMAVTDQDRELREKLRRIEALYAGATTDGERVAAKAAIERIRARLQQTERVERAEEFKFTLDDEWSRKLFLALCRRYGLSPYRYKRQRRTTVMVRAPRSFVEKTLEPEFRELQDALFEYLQQATERIIQEEIGRDFSDAVFRRR